VVRHPEEEASIRKKKEIGEAKGPGTVRPPQDTKSDTLLGHPEDEGKSYAGVSLSNDEDYAGRPMKGKKLGDFDIYRKHRKHGSKKS
jgi:hypothetical protein